MPVMTLSPVGRRVPFHSPALRNGTTAPSFSALRVTNTSGSVRVRTPSTFPYRSQAPVRPGRMRHSTGQASQVTMPSLSSLSGAVFMSFGRLALKGRQHAIGRRRHAGQPDAGGVTNGAQDGRRRRNQSRLADALGAIRTQRCAVFDDDDLDLRNIAHRRNQIVVQILAASGQV